ncbi:putative bifunctional diguanylate cyclase/phosphodiesterase [Anaeromicrobium sediminis]|nr:bifunctional diguanylate cyclase/phosphodiesterase [Anaeromicrobium sediminis]
MVDLIDEFDNYIHIPRVIDKYYNDISLLVGLLITVISFSLIIKQLKKMVIFDPLTGLLNRRGFFEKAEKELEIAIKNDTTVEVFFIDLNRFKMINDSLGHSVGDSLLREVSKRLKSHIRETDILSRVSGDEFLIMSQNTHRESIEKIASRIVDAFSNPFQVEEHNVIINASVGLSSFPTHGDNIEEIIKCADIAMYHSKIHGMKYEMYNSDMGHSICKKVILENDIRKGLENKEFYVHYQPQVDAKSNKIIGVEALLRWNHHTKGIISPLEYISLAEETGLIIPIGEMVLREACKQNKTWQEKGYENIKMSVNISIRQLQNNDFVNMVLNILEETKLDPKYLTLEIVETLVAKNMADISAKLNQLKEYGINISIDDFGTGYSSLSYLNDLPINSIKIDRSFVSHSTYNTKDQAIISMIITMAHSLNLSVVAEGVETNQQLEFLRKCGCDFIQGYFTGKPNGPIEIEKNYIQKLEVTQG